MHWLGNWTSVLVIKRNKKHSRLFVCVCTVIFIIEMDSHGISTANIESARVNLAALPNDVEMKGFLWKWTNYIKGYQKRLFLLSDGFLYYYKYPAVGKKQR